MNNIYRISNHQVVDGHINFFHYDRPMRFVEGKGFVYGEPKEMLWFALDFSKQKDFTISSRRQISNGVPTCSGREMMDYLRKVNGAKCLSSITKQHFDTDPYGRQWADGFVTYETWDLSNLFI